MTAHDPKPPESGDNELLSIAEIEAIQDAVTQAVLDSPAGLTEQLENDQTAYLKLVAASRIASDQAASVLHDSISGARTAGHSWDTIGRTLGISKQGAQQRFSSPSARSQLAADPGTNERKILSPLTAFNEMAALEREGRLGWHSVGFGALYHLVERSPHQWEHRRFPWMPRKSLRDRMLSEGWILVIGDSFPWTYFKRELDIPAASD